MSIGIFFRLMMYVTQQVAQCEVATTGHMSWPGNSSPPLYPLASFIVLHAGMSTSLGTCAGWWPPRPRHTLSAPISRALRG
jgi:hypothetical protein